MKSDLTADRVRELLSYDSATGQFIWRVRAGKAIAKGAVAGGSSPRARYREIRIDGKSYLAHRIAWLHVHGAWPSGMIDHINGNKLDNRIANLRVTDAQGNGENRTKALRGSSVPLLGVSLYRPTGRYRAQIVASGKPHHLGYFLTPEEAHAAYVTAKRRLHAFGTL